MQMHLYMHTLLYYMYFYMLADGDCAKNLAPKVKWKWKGTIILECQGEYISKCVCIWTYASLQYLKGQTFNSIQGYGKGENKLSGICS